MSERSASCDDTFLRDDNIGTQIHNRLTESKPKPIGSLSGRRPAMPKTPGPAPQSGATEPSRALPGR